MSSFPTIQTHERESARGMSSRRHLTAALAVALLVVTVLAVAPAAAADTGAPATAPVAAAAAPAGSPVRPLALGVSMLPYSDLSVLDQFASDSGSGRMPAAWSVWSDWGGSNKEFPTELMDGLLARGVTPIVLWEPIDPSDPTNQDHPSYSYQSMIRGKYDAYVRAWAQAAKDWGHPVLLRFAHEFNGTWFPWGVQRFSNTPKLFIQAWRHVWNIFRGKNGVGAKNVRFVWSPNQPCGQCTSYTKLYPGDKYVDYAAFSSFNWSGKVPWKSMVQAFELSMKGLAKVTRKPVIVAETGSSAKGGDKATWIRKGYPAVHKKWPRIKLIIYFNIDTRDVGQRDWRLVSPASALDAYRSILARPSFQGSIN